MCYDTAQLAYRIYKEAIRLKASPDEIEELRKRWKKLAGDDEPDVFHASGYQHPKLAVFESEGGKIQIDQQTWGLIPHWVKDEQSAKEIWNRTLNARGETIFEKPSFRDASKSNRVIIPLDGFFEHHHKHGKAFPYFIQSTNKERLLVGGISSDWLNKVTGEIMRTFSIVTTKGNELMSEIHNNPKLKEPRMPLILNEKGIEQWLNGNQEDATELIRPNAEVELEAHTVSRLRGKDYKGNVPEVQEEFNYEELNEQGSLFD